MRSFSVLSDLMSRKFLEKIRTVFREIDLQPHRFWPSSNYLKSTCKNYRGNIIFVDYSEPFNSIQKRKIGQILLVYCLPKDTVTAVTIFYKNTKAVLCSPDNDTGLSDIIAGVLPGDILAPYLFIIYLDYKLRTSIKLIKENGFQLKRVRSRRYPAQTITDESYTDNPVLHANTLTQAKSLLHNLEQTVGGIELNLNANKMEFMSIKQKGAFSIWSGKPLKFIDQFTYLGSNISSTESNINIHIEMVLTPIDRLSILRKSTKSD